MYANSDVIFFQDLIEAVQGIDKPAFLICGRRLELDVKEEIDFEDRGWFDKYDQTFAQLLLENVQGFVSAKRRLQGL